MGRCDGVFLGQELREEESPGKQQDAAGKQTRSLHTAGSSDLESPLDPALQHPHLPDLSQEAAS